MRCNNCGNYIPDDSDFCPFCGKRVEKYDLGSSYGYRSYDSPSVEDRGPDPKKTKRNIIIAVIIIAVAAACTGFLVYHHHVQQEKTKQEQKLKKERQAREKAQEEKEKAEDQKESAEDDAAAARKEAADARAQLENREQQVKNGSVGEYVFPASDSANLTTSDLAGMSEWELTLGLNELYARHGYSFPKSTPIRNYFSSMPWYSPETADAGAVENEFNSHERKNRDLIVNYMNSHDMDRSIYND